MIKRVLISTADKTGLPQFIQQIATHNIEFIATGNTAKLLRDHNIPITEVSSLTGLPELMGGRVKTLHPALYAGILARRGTDEACLAKHGFAPIDMVIVNLYPFANTIAQANCSLEDAIEQIDIGGPTLLRAAAKNNHYVTVVCDPKDYKSIADEIKKSGNTSIKNRQILAAKVFAHTAKYDHIISNYLQQQIKANSDTKSLSLEQIASLRYGENPQQNAKLYIETPQPNSLAQAQCIQGKALSYNNYVDADAAISCVRNVDKGKAACAIIKHATPCGVAYADTLHHAYSKALRCDSESAFGGIIAVNQALDLTTAELISQQFAEVIIAPCIDDDAKALLANKKNLRIILCDVHSQHNFQQIKTIDGGILIQDEDSSNFNPDNFTHATSAAPTAQQRQDLYFAWHIVAQVKSNAIVFAKDGMTMGIGSGQTSRIFSAKIAALKAAQAGLDLTGAVMASDAFFPFADSVEFAASLGISAIIQPGGSKRDAEVIAKANQENMCMLLTHTRHFKH